MPVKVDGLAAGEEARIVVAAVDVGILNLTNYKPPAPDDYYLGQRRAQRRDPRSLRPADRRHAGHARPDPHRRRRRRRRAAGHRRRRRSRSRSIPASSRSAPTARPKSSFDIPAFAGTVRVMAVAWTQGQGRPRHRRRHRPRSGGAHGDAAALPADRRPSHLHLDLDNVEGPGGRLHASTVTSEGADVAADGAADSCTLQRQAAQRVAVPLDGRRGGRRHGRWCSVTGPGGFALERNYRAHRQAGDADR